MSVTLVVNGVSYSYPKPSDETWGPDATNWAIGVTEALSQVISEGDIGPTTLVAIANNQAVAANIANLIMDSSTIRAAFIEYYVYRVWNSGASEVAEAGTMIFVYKDIAATWTFVPVGLGISSTGTTFSITSGGQVQYVTTNLTPSTGYSGTMKYRVRALQKV